MFEATFGSGRGTLSLPSLPTIGVFEFPPMISSICTTSPLCLFSMLSPPSAIRVFQFPPIIWYLWYVRPPIASTPNALSNPTSNPLFFPFNLGSRSCTFVWFYARGWRSVGLVELRWNVAANKVRDNYFGWTMSRWLRHNRYLTLPQLVAQFSWGLGDR